MTIAQSVLSVVENERLQENARQVGSYLLDQLTLLQDKHVCIGDVRGRGLCIGVDIVTNRETKEPASDIAKQIVTWSVFQLLIYLPIYLYDSVLSLSLL